MTFAHQPLEWDEQGKEAIDPDNQYIRLLEILPGRDSDRIHCCIRHVRLRDKPTYCALSYVWGNPANPSTIYLTQGPTGLSAAHSDDSTTDQELEVTQNLHLALKQLRSHFTSNKDEVDQGRALLWIDAISINQNDDVEKGRQVRVMRDIYRCASQTIIWLGPEEEESNLGLKFTHELLQAREGQRQKGDTRNIFQLPVRLDGFQVLPRDYNLPMPPEARYKALYRILDRPWFSRVWIIQEAAVSQYSVIHCGNAQVPLADFLNAVQYCTFDLGCGVLYKSANLLKMTKLWNAWFCVQQDQRQSLMDLLQEHRDFDSTDPRDKVFALCGLARDAGGGEGGLDVEIAYHGDWKKEDDLARDTARVYTEVAQRIITRSHSLDLLSSTRASSQEMAEHPLPSWVPDWRVADSYMSFRTRSTEDDHFFPFDAADPAGEHDIVVDGKKRELHIRGHELDTIVDIGPVWDIGAMKSSFSFVDEYFTTLRRQRILYEWERLCNARSRSKYRDTDEDMLSAYWHTLVAGGMYENKQIDPTHFADFDYSRRLFRGIYFLRLNYVPLLYHLASLLMIGVIAMRNLVGKGSLDMTFQLRMGVTTPTRRMWRGKTGHIGLAPAEARVGDVLTLCKGAMVPLVLRKNDTGSWESIGEAYVHGAMMGDEFVSQQCCEIVLV